ncbi:MAG: hypothetical protein K2K20_09285 [Lachnospiraceae bacterium]|nr:hypothetical protein [Lachnospiraceae bacterium]
MLKRRHRKKRADRNSKRQSVRKQVQLKVKDRLFRFLFEKDRDALLDLYNALNRTAYTDPSQLEIVTIESAVYVVMKNDLAYILSGTLNMYEHQSTYSPNLPVRFLIYLAQEYQMVIDRAEKSLYGGGRITLPTPQCVVFYNGMKEMPEETTLKLSDAFENKSARADVELTVRMLNINHGHNKALMENCRVLDEYSQMVAATRKYMAVEADAQTALNKAVDYCIENGILKEFLLRNRAEVLGMLLEEFDAEKYERTIREEGRDEGIKEGEAKVNRLGVLLTEAGRGGDFLESLSDRELQKKLFIEFGLEEEKQGSGII